MIKALKISKGADAVIYDSRRKAVLIPCGVDGSLFEISPEAHEIVAVSKAQVTARTGAIDPTTGDLFLPAASITATSSAEEKVQAVPGSFVLLVMRAH